MIQKRTYGKVHWIDIISPTAEEVREIIETKGINPDVAKNMLLPSPKPQVYDYDNLLYIVLHFPVRSNKGGVHTQEVDFLITKDTLVTIHYEPIDAIEQFAKYFEVIAVLKEQQISHAGIVFFEIIKQLYTTVRDQIDGIEDQVARIEPKVFNGREKQVVTALAALNHDLLQFKQVIGPQHEILETISVYAETIFGEPFKKIAHTLINEHSKVIKEIEYKKETLEELRNTNNTLLSTKENEIMKNLTMVSFITFPLSLIVAMFDLFANLKTAQGTTEDFWVLIAILSVAVVCMIFFFKHKRWV